MLDTAVILIFLTIWIYTILFLAISDDAVEKENRFVTTNDILYLFFNKNDEIDVLRKIRIYALIGLILSLIFLVTGLISGDSLPSSVSFFDDYLPILYPVIVIIYLSYLYKRLYQLRVDASAQKSFYQTYFKGYDHLPSHKRIYVIATDVICLVLFITVLITNY